MLAPKMGPQRYEALRDFDHALFGESTREAGQSSGSARRDEYLWDMQQARVAQDGTAHWVEVCFCRIPLEEERPYWEAYFDLISVKNAHARQNCRDLNGAEPWACSECDCTRRLDEKLQSSSESFLTRLRSEA